MTPGASSDFFKAIEQGLRETLPPDGCEIKVRQFRGNFQVYLENPRIHYEIWLDNRRRHIELGLHLEGEITSTIRLLRCLDAHIVEIKGELGEDVDLERWTNTWGRLVEFHSIEPKSADRGSSFGVRLADYIRVLEPILVDCD